MDYFLVFYVRSVSNIVIGLLTFLENLFPVSPKWKCQGEQSVTVPNIYYSRYLDREMHLRAPAILITSKKHFHNLRHTKDPCVI